MKNGFFTRTITITGTSYAAGVWTLTTQAAHLFVPGDVIEVFDKSANGYGKVQVTTIAGTTGTTIKFNYNNELADFVSVFQTSKFPTGFVGSSDVLNLNSSDVANFQATTITTSGTGSHGASIKVSNDGIGWITAGTFSATAGASPVSDNVSITVPWVYAKVDITSLVGTGGQTLFSYITDRV